jgi:hypothetical protein
MLYVGVFTKIFGTVPPLGRLEPVFPPPASTSQKCSRTQKSGMDYDERAERHHGVTATATIAASTTRLVHH